MDGRLSTTICPRCEKAARLMVADDRGALLQVANALKIDLNDLPGSTPEEEWAALRQAVVLHVRDLVGVKPRRGSAPG